MAIRASLPAALCGIFNLHAKFAVQPYIPREPDRPTVNRRQDILIPTPHRWARFECKYLLTNTLAEKIRLWIQPYVEPDPHAAQSPDHSYRISSLYLDTQDLRLYRETIDGVERRNKLRIRRYSRDPASPIFLEIKRREDRVVEKVRAKVDDDTVAKILAGEAPRGTDLGLSGGALRSYEEFVRVYTELAVVPIVHVGYNRQAYVGLYQQDVRVTFDRHIIAEPAGARDALVPDADAASVEDVMVVLELKFNDRFPSWMQHCVQHFGLRRTSYSKYGNSLERSCAGSLGHSSFLSRDQLPPVTRLHEAREQESA